MPSASGRTIRLPLQGLSPGVRRLDLEASRYLAFVLRVRVGDRVHCFDPVSRCEGEGVVQSITVETVTLLCMELHPSVQVAARALGWLQGLAKGEKCDTVVRQSTELGATWVGLVETSHSVVHLVDRVRLEKQQRWSRIALEAARQCGRSDPPQVAVFSHWKEGLDAVPQEAFRICLTPSARIPLAQLLQHVEGHTTPLVFAAGPEGGFSEEECRTAVQEGWHTASLGGFVLRTETVAAAVLGAVRVGNF